MNKLIKKGAIEEDKKALIYLERASENLEKAKIRLENNHGAEEMRKELLKIEMIDSEILDIYKKLHDEMIDYAISDE